MRRVLLFIVLLALGVGLLTILAERQGGPSLEGADEKSEQTPEHFPPEAASAQGFTKGLEFVNYRTGHSEDGSRVVESAVFAERAFDQGNGYWNLEDVTLRAFQEKDPSAESFLLQAKHGFMAMSGRFGDMTVDAGKPVRFQDVVVDFYDAKGDMPPIRVRAPIFEGNLEAKRFWTDSTFTLEQPDSEDFQGSGEGLEADAREGILVMKKNPRIRYWIRQTPSAPPMREARLRCLGPLKIEKTGAGTEGVSPGSRLAQAEGKASLEIEDLATHSTQTVHAEKLMSWMRSDRATPEDSEMPGGKKRSPFVFERIDAFENLRVESAQAHLFGDRARAVLAKSGRLAELEVFGSPRAAFAPGSASSISPSSSGPPPSIFIRCEGPLEFSESESDGGSFRMRFEKNVRLFGAGALAYLPSRFGEQLELQLEKTAGSSSEDSSFRILGAYADGGVSWVGTDSAVLAPTMRMKPFSDGGTQIAFLPSPLLETQFASAALSSGSASIETARSLALFAENRLVQKSPPAGNAGGEVLLQGRVWGRITGGGAPPAKLESNGLRLLSPRPGVTQIATEQGFFYDEGPGGLRMRADRVEPYGEQGMRLVGSPAELRQPGQNGKPLEITASSISFDPISGEFRAQGNVIAFLPQEAGPPLRLECQVLEGLKASGEGQGLLRLDAYQEIKLWNQGQEAGGESLRFDFAENVTRLFGTEDRPAWIAGPMDQGRFSAKSRRIELRDSGENVRLAPGALVTISGKAVDFGAMTPGGSRAVQEKDPQKTGVRILSGGESRIEKETVVFRGGVSLETSAAASEGGWTLTCRELTLHRDPVSGELRKLEAQEDVKYTSSEMLATGTEMLFWPKESDLFLLGDERISATLQIASQIPCYSDRIHYNLATNLISSGPGIAIPSR